MYKFVALYKPPADAAEFDAHFFGEHMPLIAKVPGLVKIDAFRPRGSSRGPAEHYLIAALYFDDEAAFKAAMGSPEMKAAGENLMTFASNLVATESGTLIDPLTGK